MNEEICTKCLIKMTRPEKIPDELSDILICMKCHQVYVSPKISVDSINLVYDPKLDKDLS